ncbi:uncharacterized protein [Triticum aestivum]|uniref:uncharacterized protein n=1 Tax=Triticum aestivum TaxID=4565 RepID=UPI001D00C23C|nr:uncharacterized protein LOC123134147 [Triticum aestivum]
MDSELGHTDWAGMDELDVDGDKSAAMPDFACPYCYEDHGPLFSVAMTTTAVLTHAIEDGVDRQHPHFFWPCFPNKEMVLVSNVQISSCFRLPLKNKIITMNSSVKLLLYLN